MKRQKLHPALFGRRHSEIGRWADTLAFSPCLVPAIIGCRSASNMGLCSLLSLGLRLVAWSVAATLLSLLAVAIYRLFMHPLAGVPGPRLAAVSNVWQARHVRNGRARALGRTLHAEYGPVVRIGPNEVCFNTAEAFREIYRMDIPSLTCSLLTSSGPGNVYEKSNFYRS